MFQTSVLQKIKTHISHSIFSPSKIVPFVRCCENKNGTARQATVGKLAIWHDAKNMRFACRITKARINTPHSMLVALSTAKMITLTRLSAMFYVHFLSCCNNFSSKGPVYVRGSLKIFQQLHIHVVSNRNYRFTRRHEISLSLFRRHFHRTRNWTQLRTYIKK